MKTILITGAASGVGLEVARLFKDERLILIDKDALKLKDVKNEIKADAYTCDISSNLNLSKVMEKILKKYESIDILVNCAGLWTKGELTKQQEGHFADLNSFERIKNLIDTNTFGTIAMIKHLVPVMKKQGYGQIININSQSGVVIEEFCPVYNASKHGSRAFSQAVIADLAKVNIRLTDICPGLIKTNFYINASDPLSKEIMETGLEAIEIANVVKYLVDLPANITIPSIEIKDIKNY